MRYVHRCRACGVIFVSSIQTQHTCQAHRGCIIELAHYVAETHHGPGKQPEALAERLERAGMQIVCIDGEPHGIQPKEV